MKNKILAILKQFEQHDYKTGGVSIAPEMYDAIANKIYFESEQREREAAWEAWKKGLHDRNPINPLTADGLNVAKSLFNKWYNSRSTEIKKEVFYCPACSEEWDTELKSIQCCM